MRPQRINAGILSAEAEIAPILRDAAETTKE